MELEKYLTPEESAWFDLSDAEDFYDKGPGFA